MDTPQSIPQPAPQPIDDSVQQPPKPFPLLPVLLSLFSLLLLLSTGYLAYQNWQLGKEIASIKARPSPSPTPSPTPDPTANWKTYTNTRDGFSLKYPSDWKVLGLVRGEGTEAASETSYGIVTMPQAQNEKARYLVALQIEVDTPENLARGDYKTWLTNIRNNQFFKITNESVPMPIIAGRNVTTLEGTFTESSITTYHKNYLFQSPDSKNFYSIATTDSQEQTNKVTYNQILSTFKFLGQTTTSSEWISSRSPTCNVTFTYPPKNPDLSGRYWQFEEYKAPMFMFETTSRAIYRAPEEASGYVSGDVEVVCSPNTANYTNDTLMSKLEQDLSSTTGDFATTIKSKVKGNMWGKEVTIVKFQGGMFGNDDHYIFATSKHIYLVRKISQSSDQVVKDATEKIFSGLKLLD